MPEYRPDAPSVDVFTADELLVLSEWFGVVLSRSEELALWSRRVVRPSGRPHAEDEDDEPLSSRSIASLTNGASPKKSPSCIHAAA